MPPSFLSMIAARDQARRLLWPWGGLLFVLAAAGCDSTPGPAGSGKTGNAQAVGSPAAEDARCDDMLRSVADTFQLGGLAARSDLDFGVSMINQWQQFCGKSLPAIDTGLPASAEKQLTSVQAAIINEARFVRRDGEHLRRCVLFKGVNAWAQGRGDNELTRVDHLFQALVRAVDLVASQPAHLPLDPYQVLLLGKGTVRDRAWIFSGLLRQMKIDSALLFRPDTPGEVMDSAEAPTPMLVAVFLDGQAYLFDPALGLAVPSLAANGAVRPATLAEAAEDPAVFRQFDLDANSPYAWSAADLRRLRVAVVGGAEYWSPRMLRLQPQFTGDRSLVIADGLGDSAGQPGLWSRIVRAGGKYWADDALTLWNYPDAALSARDALSASQQQEMQRIRITWDAPLKLSVDPAGQISAAKGEGDHLKTRLAHVSGEFASAIMGYSALRLACRLPRQLIVPNYIQVMYGQTDDNAAFWTGSAQLDQGAFAVAADTFQKYLKAHPQGAWVNAAHYQRALCLAALNQQAEAAAALDDVPSDAPQYAGCQLLIRRWRNLPRAHGSK